MRGAKANENEDMFDERLLAFLQLLSLKQRHKNVYNVRSFAVVSLRDEWLYRSVSEYVPFEKEGSTAQT